MGDVGGETAFRTGEEPRDDRGLPERRWDMVRSRGAGGVEYHPLFPIFSSACLLVGGLLLWVWRTNVDADQVTGRSVARPPRKRVNEELAPPLTGEKWGLLWVQAALGMLGRQLWSRTWWPGFD